MPLSVGKCFQVCVLCLHISTVGEAVPLSAQTQVPTPKARKTALQKARADATQFAKDTVQRLCGRAPIAKKHRSAAGRVDRLIEEEVLDARVVTRILGDAKALFNACKEKVNQLRFVADLREFIDTGQLHCASGASCDLDARVGDVLN
eukprot:2764860-Lingulodinium_polyedra.AAC.1